MHLDGLEGSTTLHPTHAIATDDFTDRRDPGAEDQVAVFGHNGTVPADGLVMDQVVAYVGTTPQTAWQFCTYAGGTAFPLASYPGCPNSPGEESGASGTFLAAGYVGSNARTTWQFRFEPGPVGVGVSFTGPATVDSVGWASAWINLAGQ